MMKTKYVAYIIGLKSMFVERGYSDKSELIKIEKKAHVQELELIAAGESSDVFSGLTTHEEKEKKNVVYHNCISIWYNWNNSHKDKLVKIENFISEIYLEIISE